MANDVLVPDALSPEGMEVIEAYIANGSDAKAAAQQLGITEQTCREILRRPEVKSYLTDIFMEGGFRNREKLFGVFDEVVKLKLEEMEESGAGSEMDIVDILSKYHKMKMDELKMQIELEKLRKANTPASQTNIQNNIIAGSNDSNYMDLLNRLAGVGGKK